MSETTGPKTLIVRWELRCDNHRVRCNSRAEARELRRWNNDHSKECAPHVIFRIEEREES